MPSHASSSPSHPRAVAEVPADEAGVRFYHPGWARDLPWLIQGITTRAMGDLGLFTASPGVEVQDRWRRLLEATACAAGAHARQVHGSAVRLHEGPPAGLLLAPDADGHATRTTGLLLAVTVADCVPVYLVHETARAVALLHAGWRGVAAGILDEGLKILSARLGLDAQGMRVHLGPSICGACYEVGPEVHDALGLEVPPGPKPVDLRAVLARQAAAVGIPAGAVTWSEHCTRCGDGAFFSHRRGDSQRQVAYLARLA